MTPVIRYSSKQGAIVPETVGKRCLNCGRFVPVERKA